jgi:GGDEF domain-containing protein
MVCRLGSDEFGMMLHDIGRPADVLLFVKMIMKNVPQIVMSGGEEIAVTLAIGIAMFPADGQRTRPCPRLRTWAGTITSSTQRT